MLIFGSNDGGCERARGLFHSFTFPTHTRAASLTEERHGKWHRKFPTFPLCFTRPSPSSHTVADGRQGSRERFIFLRSVPSSSYFSGRPREPRVESGNTRAFYSLAVAAAGSSRLLSFGETVVAVAVVVAEWEPMGPSPKSPPLSHGEPGALSMDASPAPGSGQASTHLG